MRSAFIVTILLALLTVGYLVIQNMGSHSQKDENGHIEEVEQARRAAAQAEEQMQNVRNAVNRQ